MSDYKQVSSGLISKLRERILSLPGIDQAVIEIKDQVETQDIGLLSVLDILPKADPVKHKKTETAVVRSLTKQTKVDSDPPSRPSICNGGALYELENFPRTLPQALKRAAGNAPDNGVFYLNQDGEEDFQSYPELVEDAERILTGLRRIGLKPGDKVIFQLDDNRGFISCHWACLFGGFVQVPISIAPTYKEKNLTVNKLINTWKSLDRPVFLTTRNLESALYELAASEEMSELRLIIFEDLLNNKPDRQWVEAAPDDVVIFLLTSGSTGVPKLVQQCHRSLLSRSAGTVELNGFTLDEVTLNWMPLDHVGGIVMWHIRDVYLACRQIHVPTQMILEKPLLWLDIIDKYRASLTWAPNFAYGLINDQLSKQERGNWDLSSMRSILNGGEAVVAKTARKFLKLLAPYGLPPKSMQPAWGMSETCSGVTHSLQFSLDTTCNRIPLC